MYVGRENMNVCTNGGGKKGERRERERERERGLFPQTESPSVTQT